MPYLKEANYYFFLDVVIDFNVFYARVENKVLCKI